MPDTHRWPRATTTEHNWGQLCDCGNLKTDQALTCTDCRIGIGTAERKERAVRFLFRVPGASRRVMHIMRFTETGEYTDEALCGRSGFNRSINAPWGLGRPRCRDCLRRLA